VRLTLHARATIEAVQAEPADGPEVFYGLLVPWDTPGRTSAGTVSVPRGAIRLPADLGRVKVLTEHDRERPVGVLAAADDTDDGLRVGIRFGSTREAQRARAELVDGLRDGLSLDLIDVELNKAGDRLQGGELLAIGHVTIPAYSDSRALAAGRDEGDTMEDQPDTIAAVPPDDQPVQVAAPPAAMTASRARTKPASPALELARRLVAARFDGGDSAVQGVLQAALADITPAGNGAGNENAGLAVQAVGELWDGIQYVPQHLPLVTERPLTGVKFGGWSWVVKPVVGDYTGNKTDIPSNAATLDWVEGPALRLAGGHDLDRIYLDLGDPAFVASYWRNMTESLAEQLDDKRLNAAVTAAGTAGTAGSVIDAILQGITAVKRPTYAAVAQDLWNTQLSQPVDTLPAFFVQNNLFTGPGLDIFPTDGLTGQVLVGAKGAVDFFTKQPPVRVEGVNVAKAGFDAGLYGYYGSLTVDASRVKIYTVTVVPLGAGTTGGREGGNGGESGGRRK